MRLHILEHVPYEGPGAILDWAKMKNAAVGFTRFHEPGWILPDPGGLDMLVVMGGPMSANDDDRYPWMIPEKEFLRDCIAAGKNVLGICLGAQLAAQALGAKVYPNKEREIGWFPIFKTALPHPVLWDMPPDCTVFHWHGETFDLPDGAIHLAHSEGCANQAFIWGEQVLGLQYHLEMRPEHIEALLAHCGEDLKTPGPRVQLPGAIREGFAHADMLPPLLDAMLNRFTS